MEEALRVPLAEIAREHELEYAPDLDPKNRPGVPMEFSPAKATGKKPARQRRPSNVRVFRRKGLDQLTPVFGTAQPPRGLSGAIKAAAYRKAEDRPAHWALLMLSDRVDVIEGKIADAFRRPLIPLTVVALGGLAIFALRQRRKTA